MFIVNGLCKSHPYVVLQKSCKITKKTLQNQRTWPKKISPDFSDHILELFTRHPGLVLDFGPVVIHGIGRVMQEGGNLG